MTRYFASAAAAAVLGAIAFAGPAAAQVGVGIHVGPDRDYYGDRYYDERPRAGVRVYSGRNSYRDDDCYTKRRVVWRDGRKIVRTTRVCD